MNILSSLSKLFFSSPSKPSGNVVTPARVEEPEATAQEPPIKYTADDIATVLRRGQAVKAMFDEALTRASRSPSRKERLACLEIARSRLVTLKHFKAEFPFFNLTNLPAVEASIVAIEAETRAMSDDESNVPTVHSSNRQSESDEAVTLDSIQRLFEVITESITLARKSKNLDTKVSRLRVARTRLIEARAQATRYSLDVRGFDEAEIEICRIEVAMRDDMPTEIDGMLDVEQPILPSVAYALLREATVLKRARLFLDACVKLREAYAAPGAENLLIEDRLRLPMYLQLAGKNDDGWDELNRLAKQYTDAFSRPRIAHQRTVFLRKEKNESATNPVRVVARGDEKIKHPSPPSADVSIAAVQHAPMPSLSSDLCKGFAFSATFQLRTPLRVLRREGELYSKLDGKQPQIALEAWEGCWVPLIKTWKELSGVDIPEFGASTVASDAGYVDSDEYLAFLKALREIVETVATIEERLAQLDVLQTETRWSKFLSEHGGTDGIAATLFPRFTDRLPGISEAMKVTLNQMGFNTANKLAAATDKEILEIPGVGPSKLRAIRAHCASIQSNRDADRIDRVSR